MASLPANTSFIASRVACPPEKMSLLAVISGWLNLQLRGLVSSKERFPQCYKLSFSGSRSQRCFSERVCPGFCSLFNEPISD